MSKKEGKEKKNSAGFITVVVLLAVILAALIALATLATLGYFGGSSETESSEVDESSEVEESDTTTDFSEDEGETHTHSYEFSYIAPTCTEQGYIIMTCTECGDSYQEVIPATGHTFETGVITTEATCTEDAEVTFACSVCGQSYTIVVEGTALGHDYSVIVSDEGKGVHHTVCSRCGQVEEDSLTLCTYNENKYACDDDGKLHSVCDVCGGLSVNTIETLPASTDGTYTFEVNSGAGLANALDALNDASTTDGAQSTITLTEDLTLDEGESGTFEISASNVILDGGEDGSTLSSGHEITVSGDNVTIKNITIDGSSTPSDIETYAHAIEINGNDVTLENCTIIGGEATTYTSAVLIDLQPGEGDDGLIEIKGCDISGAFRGIYIVNAGNVDLHVSDSYIESTYAINETGNTEANLYFTNCSLMGWTSYATSGVKSFTDCTLGYCDVGDYKTSYGFLRAYHGETTFTNCFFESATSRQARTENNLVVASYNYLGETNYGFGSSGSDVTYLFLNCTFENTTTDEDGNVDVEVMELNAETGAYLMTVDFDAESGTGTGFRFEADGNIYSYSCYSSMFTN